MCARSRERNRPKDLDTEDVRITLNCDTQPVELLNTNFPIHHEWDRASGQFQSSHLILSCVEDSKTGETKKRKIVLWEWVLLLSQLWSYVSPCAYERDCRGTEDYARGEQEILDQQRLARLQRGTPQEKWFDIEEDDTRQMAKTSVISCKLISRRRSVVIVFFCIFLKSSSSSYWSNLKIMFAFVSNSIQFVSFSFR